MKYIFIYMRIYQISISVGASFDFPFNFMRSINSQFFYSLSTPYKIYFDLYIEKKNKNKD